MPQPSSPLPPSPGRWIRAIANLQDPAVAKARHCLVEMGHRSFQVHGRPVRIAVEVLDTDFPWAGVIHDDVPRARGSMFVTRGLVNRLTQEQLIAVMGHEWGHVADRRRAAEWALRGTALSATLGLHALALGVFLAVPETSWGGWAVWATVALTLGAMGLCLSWERRAQHQQELACDRFAARLVGPRTMVTALRRVDALVARALPPSKRRAQRLIDRVRSTHPSVGQRVLHIARHRRRLEGGR